jgi:hypothetical protein
MRLACPTTSHTAPTLVYLPQQTCFLARPQPQSDGPGPTGSGRVVPAPLRPRGDGRRHHRRLLHIEPAPWR